LYNNGNSVSYAPEINDCENLTTKEQIGKKLPKSV